MGKKVLVIDDSESIRQQVRDTLAAAGFEVIEAEDGMLGLNAIGENADLSVVVCDVVMPRMDGLEMLEKVKANPANAKLPILMLTAEAQGSLMQRAKRAGAVGWIIKPFRSEMLVAAVRKLAI